MSKTFCIRPWVHSCIRTNGDFALCCKSDETSKHNIRTSTINDWWNDSLLKDIRDQMLKGQRPEECKACWQHEDLGHESLRQITNREYKIFEKSANKTINHFKYPAKLPIDIEISLTNLCNLKCMSCSESESSSILAENKLLKINKVNQSEFTVTPDQFDKLKDCLHIGLKKLVLRGGEPLMVPEIEALLKYAVKNNLLQNTTVNITTNGTKFTQAWFDILSQIENLKLMTSIDSYGDLNSYIRFGSDWSTLEKNCKWMSSIPNVNFFIHSTVSNLSILHLDKLMDWCDANQYYLQYDLLNYPYNLHVTNLPRELKELVIRKLKDRKKVSKIISLLKSNYHIGNWHSFQDMIKLRENFRKNSLIKICPEFAPYINTK